MQALLVVRTPGGSLRTQRPTPAPESATNARLTSGFRAPPRHTVGVVTRAELHHLVDTLPEESVDVAGLLLQCASDPLVVGHHAAPLDDEPYTAEEMAADAAALPEPRIPLDLS